MDYAIHVAETPEAIRACHPVIVQLRPHLEEEALVSQVLRQSKGGYRLAALEL